MGRPPLAEGKAREVVFTVRLSQEEREEIAAAAGRDGKAVTQWARAALLRTAQADNAGKL